MKILLATFSGSAVAALCAMIGQWLLSGAANFPSIHYAALGAPGLSVVMAAGALVAGAFVAVRIHDSVETLSGFATVQLFLGPALARRFWLAGPSSAIAALLVVLLFTVAGAALASRRHLAGLLEPG
jgi:hypothetical protein